MRRYESAIPIVKTLSLLSLVIALSMIPVDVYAQTQEQKQSEVVEQQESQPAIPEQGAVLKQNTDSQENTEEQTPSVDVPVEVEPHSEGTLQQDASAEEDVSVQEQEHIDAATLSQEQASGVVGTCTWTIEGDGTLVLASQEPSQVGMLQFDTDEWENPTIPWEAVKDSITSFRCDGQIRAVGSLSRMFADCWQLQSADLTNLDTSQVTDMSSMFSSCNSLSSLDLSSFDTSQVTGMSGMFEGVSTITFGVQFTTLNANAFGPGFVWTKDSQALTAEELCSLSSAERVGTWTRFAVTHGDIKCFDDASAQIDSVTITYADGCEGSVFADKVFVSQVGNTTPSFGDDPVREGYLFAGWDVELSDVVYRDVTYTATWLQLQPGWFEDAQHNVRYVLSNNQYASGWQVIDGNWYYFDASNDCIMQTGLSTVGDGQFYFNANGVMQTGWQVVDGAWYYFEGSGYAARGWVCLSGSWFYLDPQTGIMATGLTQVGNSLCYFNGAGYMQTGWQVVDGAWYYFEGSGYAARGWVCLSGSWFYLDPQTGIMATGLTQIGDSTFYFNDAGYMQTGLQKIDGFWYGFDQSGAKTKGWFCQGNIWIYTRPDDGTAMTGFNHIGDNTFYFDDSGLMQTGWQKIDGDYYYFDSQGFMLRNSWCGEFYLGSDGVLLVNGVTPDGVHVGETGQRLPKSPMIERVLSIASSQIGYSRWDDPAEGTIYGRWYAEYSGNPYFGYSGVPYCAMFTSWVFNQAGQPVSGFPSAHCGQAKNGARQGGLLVNDISSARAGDIIMFDWDHNGNPDHVGIVLCNRGDYVVTVEGNTSPDSNGSQGNGGGVYQRNRTWKDVDCVIRPLYY